MNIDVAIFYVTRRTDDIQIYYGIYQIRRHAATKEHCSNLYGIQSWMMCITQRNIYLVLWCYKDKDIDIFINESNKRIG